MKKLLLVVCLTAMMMFVAAPGAQAIVYDIASDHMTGGAGTAPFGTVSLVEEGGSVFFTVTLNTGYNFMRSGFDGTFFFNATDVLPTDFTFTSVFDAVNYGPPSVGPPNRPNGTLNAGGTGFWIFGVYDPLQGNGSEESIHGPLTFSVANATIAEVTIGNGTGNIFAVDAYSSITGNTGMLDVSGTPQVPEPSALLLLGSGLVGLAFYGRKTFKR